MRKCLTIVCRRLWLLIQKPVHVQNEKIPLRVRNCEPPLPHSFTLLSSHTKKGQIKVVPVLFMNIMIHFAGVTVISQIKRTEKLKMDCLTFFKGSSCCGSVS